MKKHLLVFLFCLLNLLAFTSFGQPYGGFSTSSYAGLQGAIFNPASLADNRLPFDINLISFDFSAGNNYLELKNSSLFNPRNIDKNTDVKEMLNGKTKGMFLNVDIMGPGFFVQLTKKDAIGFYTRVRGMLDVNGIDQATAQTIYNGVQSGQYSPYQFSGSNFNLNANVWAEYDIPYARVLYNDGVNVIKAGVTLKILQGITSDYINISGYKYSYSNIDSMKFGNGNISYGHSNNQLWSSDPTDYYKFEKGGVAVDFGGIYEYRPNYKDFSVESDGTSSMRRDIDAYQFKVGLSVTDLGTLVYNKAVESRNSLANLTPFAVSTFQNLSSIQDFDNRFNSLAGNAPSADNGKYSMNLPLAINLSGDYNFGHGLYVNLNPVFALKTGTSDVTKTHYYSTYSLTPRYEKRWWGVYVPISYNTFTGFNTGFALRAGPFFFGSETAISTLTASWVDNLDVYAGLKVYIPYKKSKGGGLDCPKMN